MLGLGRDVDGLVRVADLVVELGGVDGIVVPVAPEGQAPAVIADAVTHERFAGVAARILADGDGTHGGGGVVQHGLEADAFDVLGLGQAAEVREGGVDVDELGEREALAARGLLAGGADDQRRPRGDLKVGVLVPESVLAELPAVVAPEDDDGIVRQAFLLEGVQHEADLRVHVADGGVVTVTETTREGVADLTAVGDIGVAFELAVGVTDEAWGAGGKFLVGRDVDLGRVIEIPIFLGRDEREVRLGHADGQEEGLPALLQLAQGLRRESGGLAVGISVVGDVGFLDRRTAGTTLAISVGWVLL